ncbi:hypothetical protein OG568_29150 [Streptomyces sp. NBC_01450]|uniref:hypothetical protein n=1 Tax=Streptomyces sp. NBC_01450 TaxID=2903871 RepID=UPI002E34EACE|nr:hypothetical protein [Streptomyces sp. NBC_01450]
MLSFRSLLLPLWHLVAPFFLGTGRRRRSGGRLSLPVEEPAPRETSRWQPGKVLSSPRPPLPRSPYAREAATDQCVDVTGIPLTRPYYRAAEKRRLQGERRLALVLALEGVDCGSSVIHGSMWAV